MKALFLSIDALISAILLMFEMDPKNHYRVQLKMVQGNQDSHDLTWYRRKSNGKSLRY